MQAAFLCKSWLQDAKVVAKVLIYVTLDHRTSHKGKLFEIEIYTSSESWINKNLSL